MKKILLILLLCNVTISAMEYQVLALSDLENPSSPQSVNRTQVNINSLEHCSIERCAVIFFTGIVALYFSFRVFLSSEV